MRWNAFHLKMQQNICFYNSNYYHYYLAAAAARKISYTRLRDCSLPQLPGSHAPMLGLASKHYTVFEKISCWVCQWKNF